MRRETKQILIEIFSKKGELTIKQAADEVKNNSTEKLTYHTIYKSINKLVDENVLNKKDKKYHLSKEWCLDYLKKSTYISDYLEKKCNTINPFNTSSIYEFDDFRKAQNFIRETELKYIRKGNEKKTTIWITNHCYNYLLQPAEELNHIKRLLDNSNQLIVINRGKTILDKWTKNIYNNKGANMFLNDTFGGMAEMNVYEDFAIQAFYGRNFIKAVDSIYEKTTELENFDVGELIESLDKSDYKIGLVLYTSKVIVDSLKERALKICNKDVNLNKV